MASKSDIEMARVLLAKVTRAEVRLRYSLMADAELNTLLPARLADFDKALSEGKVRGIALALVEAGERDAGD